MGHRTPRRLATQTMATTVGTVVLILIVVLVVVTLIVRNQVRDTVIAHLTTQQGMLLSLDERRESEMRAQAEMLAESPTVKAAMDTSHAESLLTGVDDRRQLLDTVGRELDRMAQRIRPEIVAVVDPAGTVVAAGRRSGEWPRTFTRAGDAAANELVVVPDRVFRVATAPMVVQQTVVGYLQLGAALDADYAAHLTALSGARTLITSRGGVVASTLPVGATRDLTPAVLTTLPESDEVRLNDEPYAIRLLLRHGDVVVYTLDSIDAGARILRTVPFLAPHLPIVELHHERPDGKGYPHGLHADDIPMLARIVHVVDAFDAMSSARAYRPARSGTEVLQELWRCAGTQFDVAVVQALATAIPTLRMDDNRFDTAAARAARKISLVAFTRP